MTMGWIRDEVRNDKRYDPLRMGHMNNLKCGNNEKRDIDRDQDCERDRLLISTACVS